jgi:hypothetical protein
MGYVGRNIDGFCGTQENILTVNVKENFPGENNRELGRFMLVGGKNCPRTVLIAHNTEGASMPFGPVNAGPGFFVAKDELLSFGITHPSLQKQCCIYQQIRKQGRASATQQKYLLPYIFRILYHQII